MSSIQWKKLSMLKIFWNEELSNVDKEASLKVLAEFMPQEVWEQAMQDAVRLGLRVEVA